MENNFKGAALKVMNDIRAASAQNDLISKGDHIVVGLSGGPDSVCLFFALYNLMDELELTLSTVHVNHKFRPGAAEEDQEYVENLSRKLGIRQTSVVKDCNIVAKEYGITSEEAGRRVRYEAFDAEADYVLTHLGKRKDQIKIAVAHNADDQAETILFRLIRGTGTDGLSGIERKRLSEKGYTIIRPILGIKRSDIEAFCDELGLSPRIDHTNLEPIYSRNKIRLSIIPEMENINEGAVNNITAFAKLASYDEEFLSSLADKYLSDLRRGENELDLIIENEDKTSAEDIPYAILSRVIKKFLTEKGFSADRHRIDTIMDYCKNGDGFLNLSPTATLEVRGYRIILKQKKENPTVFFEIPLTSGKNFTPYKQITLIYHDNNELINKKFTNHILDCDKILGTVLVARNRRNSDRIQLVGRDFQHRIKKLYENISADEKDRKILIADEGDIIFAEDFGVSERVKVTEETKRILEIRIEEL